MPTADALLLVSFGGPEAPEDVWPFLERVTAGRAVPRERLERVAAQYLARGGVSPINAENRRLLAALRERLAMPVHWGNRNAPPFLTDALAAMRDDGVQSAFAFTTSAYGSYPGCRRYREDLAAACAAVGSGAPTITKLRAFYNHPLFVQACADAAQAARQVLPADRRPDAVLVATAHAIPLGLAATSPYVQQVHETASLVAERAGYDAPVVAWQSRSGAPSEPWLEPDVGAVLADLARRRQPGVVVAPIGFVSDHLEVVHDLDEVALPAARADGLAVARAATPGVRLADVVVALLAEQVDGAPRQYWGSRGPAHDGCPRGCCPREEARERASPRPTAR